MPSTTSLNWIGSCTAVRPIQCAENLALLTTFAIHLQPKQINNPPPGHNNHSAPFLPLCPFTSKTRGYVRKVVKDDKTTAGPRGWSSHSRASDAAAGSWPCLQFQSASRRGRPITLNPEPQAQNRAVQSEPILRMERPRERENGKEGAAITMVVANGGKNGQSANALQVTLFANATEWQLATFCKGKGLCRNLLDKGIAPANDTIAAADEWEERCQWQWQKGIPSANPWPSSSLGQETNVIQKDKLLCPPKHTNRSANCFWRLCPDYQFPFHPSVGFHRPRQDRVSPSSSGPSIAHPSAIAVHSKLADRRPFTQWKRKPTALEKWRRKQKVWKNRLGQLASCLHLSKCYEPAAFFASSSANTFVFPIHN